MATKGILGKKVGMTQVFTESGELVPVTVVEVGDIVVGEAEVQCPQCVVAEIYGSYKS